MATSFELNLFEQLVLRIELILLYLSLQESLRVLVPVTVAINWFLFRMHFIKLQSYDFFIKHYDTTSRFSRSRFNFHSTIATFVPPIGIVVIAYSVLTLFNSAKFLEMFGTSKSLFVFTKKNKFKVKIKP